MLTALLLDRLWHMGIKYANQIKSDASFDDMFFNEVVYMT